MSQYSVLPNVDVSYLDADILDENGLLKVMDDHFYSFVPQEHLQLWGHKHGVYQFPTKMLIDTLRHEINGRTAIEICAGNGAIGRALGIPMTDSHLQARPEIKEIYGMIGQPVIKYPKDVIKMEAIEAVKHYKPDVVIGSWATHKYRKGDKYGSIYGVDECKLVNMVDLYIKIGNLSVHGESPLMTKRGLSIGAYYNHEKSAEVLFSRSSVPENNAMWLWARKLGAIRGGKKHVEDD